MIKVIVNRADFQSTELVEIQFIFKDSQTNSEMLLCRVKELPTVLKALQLLLDESTAKIGGPV